MKAAVQLRAANADDVPGMHRIRLAVRENRLRNSDTVNESSYRPFIDSGAAWVAETGSGIVGFAILDVPANTVWALFVDPDSEGLGVGRSLHERMLDWARQQGLHRLALTTSEGTRAERFYRRHGWTCVGRDSDGEIRMERAV